MKYALLLYGDEALDKDITPEQWGDIMEAHDRFSVEAAQRGMNPSGEALHSVTQARTIRFKKGQNVLVTDGPFAETKEQLGGFYILECDLDTAVEMAQKLPMTEGSIEIRPVVIFEQ